MAVKLLHAIIVQLLQWALQLDMGEFATGQLSMSMITACSTKVLVTVSTLVTSEFRHCMINLLYCLNSYCSKTKEKNQLAVYMA